MKNCVFLGKLGLYHNFRVDGDQSDNFLLHEEDKDKSPKYYITTKEKNKDAALFAESGYLGLGFEYAIGKSRIFVDVDYCCQFNYFKSNVKSNVEGSQRFKTIVHSLHVIFGFLF